MRLKVESVLVGLRPVARLALFLSAATFNPLARADANQDQSATTAGANHSLADILDKLDWDARVRGPLIIVSPETTFAKARSKDLPSVGATSFVREPESPVISADGTYSLAAAAPAYDRMIVHLGNVTILAPRTMTVLQYTHLPKPDPYAGMAASWKLRVLESTFTDEQWTVAGSEAGIGTSDLTGDQSALFLSLLPQPFNVAPLQSPGAANTADVTVALTEEQRAATHLRLQKRLGWSFKQGKNGMVGMSLTSNQLDASYNYRLAYVIPTNLVPGPDGTLTLHSSVNGVDIARVGPNRAKPGQLPSDWATIDGAIRFEAAQTVGALVKEIARQTGAKLYCDPRYARLNVAVRGDSAKASDILRALCWAVTGTWRRVGDSLVLTDDLVGLGVRHVMIDDWREENALLTQLLNEKANEIVAPKEYKSIGWSATDPLKPGDALIGKLDAFVAQPPISYPNNGSAEQSPDIPLTELPQSVQAAIHEQVQRFNDRLTTEPTNGSPELPILIRRFDDPAATWENWYGSFEKPDTSLPRANKVVPERPTYYTVNTFSKWIHDRAFAESRVSYFPVVLGVAGLDKSVKPRDEQPGLLNFAMTAATAWDGLVVDVSHETAAETLDTLALFPVIDSGK